jgi:alkylation response protein AidB-like acyl-CoA dehydrogenase
MDFTLDDEQQMLADSVARFVQNDYDFETRARRLAAGDSKDKWQVFADNGWLGAAFPEEIGGFGGGVIETAIIGQGLGRALVLEPWLGSAVLAAQTLRATGDAEAIAGWMPALCDGSRRLALAWSEAQSRGVPDIVGTTADPDGANWSISGEKTLVLGAVDADAYLVSAQTGDGIALFLVGADAGGLSVVPTPLHDGSAAGTLRLDGVAARRLAGGGLEALREGLSHAILALCAELVGAMEQSIDITAEYLRTRKQFGVTIGSFQSLQHRIADMTAEMELARSMLFALLSSFENDDAATRARILHGAKALITGAARNVCGQGIQLHGGMGMTEECAIGHYFKRAVVADLLLGGRTLHETASADALRAELSGAMA